MPMPITDLSFLCRLLYLRRRLHALVPRVSFRVVQWEAAGPGASQPGRDHALGPFHSNDLMQRYFAVMKSACACRAQNQMSCTSEIIGCFHRAAPLAAPSAAGRRMPRSPRSTPECTCPCNWISRPAPCRSRRIRARARSGGNSSCSRS